MHTDNFELTRADGVATLTLNRPTRHNAFDDVLIAELTEALMELGQDPELRAVVLAGSGKSFSAGADLHWMQRMADYDRDENYRDAKALGTLMHTLDSLPKTTIARVHGAAMGGGVGLVACCDIVIAAEHALFSLSEVRLGLMPAAISPFVIKAIGERQARRYFVTAERFDAHEARRIGLVHEVVSDDELDTTIDGLLEHLRANGPEAMVAAKRQALDIGGRPVDTAMLDDSARRIADIRVGAEGQEGIAAFLEKRKPEWNRPDD